MRIFSGVVLSLMGQLSMVALLQLQTFAAGAEEVVSSPSEFVGPSQASDHQRQRRLANESAGEHDTTVKSQAPEEIAIPVADDIYYGKSQQQERPIVACAGPNCDFPQPQSW